MATETIGDGMVHMQILHLDTDIMIHFISIVIFMIRFGIQHGAAHTVLPTIHMEDTIITITDHITIIHTITTQALN